MNLPTQLVSEAHPDRPRTSGAEPAPVSWHWRHELQQFVRFVRHPWRGRPQAAQPATVHARRLLLMLALCYGFILCIALPFNAGLSWLGLDSDEEPLSFLFFVVAVGVAPVIEELIFRAGLRQAAYTLFIGPPLIASIFGSWPLMLVLGGFGTCCAIIDRLWQNRLSAGELRLLKLRRARRFLRRYPLIFWIYTIGFGLAHIHHFFGDGWLVLALPLAVGAQTFAGVALGYLRLRYGLAQSMLLHALYNLTACVLALMVARIWA